MIFDTSKIQAVSGPCDQNGSYGGLTLSTGSTSAKTISDGSGGHFISGTDANDVIYGNGGNDEIIDDWGNDRLYGGAGNDTLDGGFGSDSLDGGAGNDVIRGWEANDTAVGGAGNDSILTGAGRDVIVFNAALNRTSNVDRVTDYTVAYDTVRLENAVFKALTKTGTLGSGAFRVGVKALVSSDRIIYDKATGALSYDPDGTGPAAQIKFAQLAKNLAMKYSEFVVI